MQMVRIGWTVRLTAAWGGLQGGSRRRLGVRHNEGLKLWRPVRAKGKRRLLADLER